MDVSPSLRDFVGINIFLTKITRAQLNLNGVDTVSVVDGKPIPYLRARYFKSRQRNGSPETQKTKDLAHRLADDFFGNFNLVHRKPIGRCNDSVFYIEVLTFMPRYMASW
jgi:hypothetical protein